MTKSDPPRCNFVVNVIIDDSRWNDSEEEYSKHFEYILRNIAKKIDFSPIANIECSVKLTNNSVIQELNSSFRSKDNPTNVLSFPSYELKDGDFKDFSDLDEMYLGDIAVSYDKVEEESQSHGVEFKNHLTHMVLHSIMHLIGYDHINDKDALKMEGLEKDILKLMNIENPYE